MGTKLKKNKNLGVKNKIFKENTHKNIYFGGFLKKLGVLKTPPPIFNVVLPLT